MENDYKIIGCECIDINDYYDSLNGREQCSIVRKDLIQAFEEFAPKVTETKATIQLFAGLLTVAFLLAIFNLIGK